LIDLAQLRSIIESLLFVADEPITAEKIAQLVEEDKKSILDVLNSLKEEYEKDERGFQLRQVAGGFRLYTNSKNAVYVEHLVLSSDFRRLTQAALETLAIIVYKQPATRAYVSEIRGVNAEGSIATLLNRGLIKESGRAKTPGNPILYVTTKKFLEQLGLNNLKDLPPIEQFAPDEDTKQQIQKSFLMTDSRSPELHEA